MTQEEMDLIWEECTIRSLEQWEYRNAGDDGEEDPRAWYAIVDHNSRVYGIFLTDYHEPITVHEIDGTAPRNEDDLSDWDILPWDLEDDEPLDWEKEQPQ